MKTKAIRNEWFFKRDLILNVLPFIQDCKPSDDTAQREAAVEWQCYEDMSYHKPPHGRKWGYKHRAFYHKLRDAMR